MAAYYNEHDPKAAAWLRELIKRDLICVGEVDERSIKDVQPGDVRGFTQCHFFAGIGVWSYALRRAGWDDARPVWTGSCPCQPFSAAGKGEGFDDERHLWPELFRLVSECRPVVCFGEQTSSPVGLMWLDLVHADLEGIGYACGAANFPAAGVGAPHIRQRLYWVADAEHTRSPRAGFNPQPAGALVESGDHRREEGAANGLGNTAGDRREVRLDVHAELRREGSLEGCKSRELDDANDARLQGHGRPLDQHDAARRNTAQRHERPAGFWDDATWLPCSDGKARPVEPGSFPLAHGAPARVGRLRGYGNALVAPQAQAFIEAYLDVRGGIDA